MATTMSRENWVNRRDNDDFKLTCVGVHMNQLSQSMCNKFSCQKESPVASLNGGSAATLASVGEGSLFFV